MVTGCPTCTNVGESRVLEGHAEAGAGTRTVVRTGIDAGRIAAVVAAGSAIGFLTGLFGVGGGFVIVPALTLLLHLDMPSAIGTSLLVIAVNSAVGLAARVGESGIEWSITLPFAVAAIAGVLTGGHLAGRLAPERTPRWFAALLVPLAVYTALDALTG
jgi:uncharacterized membrane protein YfcA